MAVQRHLAGRVVHTPPATPVRLVAGLDAAFSADGRWCLAAVVLWDVERRVVVEQHTARRRLGFPYVPGLLSFREVPALLGALRKLRAHPDLVLCDGQGLAHPRRFGLACHVGVLCDLPAVGCAKSRLIGECAEPGPSRGARAALLDHGELIGSALRTRAAVRPMFVSVGHRMDLAAAERVVLDCAIGYRLPEPTRRADQLVAAFKRGENCPQPRLAPGAPELQACGRPRPQRCPFPEAAASHEPALAGSPGFSRSPAPWPAEAGTTNDAARLKAGVLVRKGQGASRDPGGDGSHPVPNSIPGPINRRRGEARPCQIPAQVHPANTPFQKGARA